MRDFDIRCVLRASVEAEHANDPNTRIVDELGLRQGVVRVDLAVINGATTGYEIKSLADTLHRLPAQVEVYSQVLDFATIVLAERHRKEAVAMIPRWWGVIVAKNSEPVSLVAARTGRRNPSVDKRALAELLWHAEALEMLRVIGADRGLKSKPRAAAWQRISQLFSVEEIGQAVRCRLKARAKLRVERQPVPDDDACRSGANRLHRLQIGGTPAH